MSFSRTNRSSNHNREHFGYRKENPYERNYDCFNIRDFKKGDSIMVYNNGDRQRGVVIESVYETREVVYKTSDGETIKTSMNSILFLKEHDSNWLNQ